MSINMHDLVFYGEDYDPFRPAARPMPQDEGYVGLLRRLDKLLEGSEPKVERIGGVAMVGSGFDSPLELGYSSSN